MSDAYRSWHGDSVEPSLADPFFADHLARYYHAAERVIPPGGDVLDLACGKGYGSAILASRARGVVWSKTIEVDQECPTPKVKIACSYRTDDGKTRDALKGKNRIESPVTCAVALPVVTEEGSHGPPEQPARTRPGNRMRCIPSE